MNRNSRFLLIPFAVAFFALFPSLAVIFLSPFPAGLIARYELWQGVRHKAAGEYGAAMRRFETAAAQMSDDPEPWLQVARLYGATENGKEAVRAWKEALVRDPANGEALQALAEEAHGRGEYVVAIELLRQALLASPDSLTMRDRLARSLAGRGDIRGARSHWEAIVANSPLDAELSSRAYHGLGLLAIVDDVYQAKALIESAKQGARDVEHFSSLANLVEVVEAILRIGHSPAAEPDREAHQAALRGYALLNAGMPLLAKSQFEQATALRPDYADALAYLGYSLYKLGDSQEAISVLRRAIVSQKYSPLAGYFLGIVSRSERQYPESIEALQHAAALDSSNRDLHWELARTYVAVGDYPSAETEYEQAILTEGDDLGLLLDFASFYLDHLFRVERALAIADKAVRVFPTSAEALDVRGWARHLSGDESGAMEDLTRAIVIRPKLAKPHYHRALVFAKTGDQVAARLEYRRVLDLDVGSLAVRAGEALAE